MTSYNLLDYAIPCDITIQISLYMNIYHILIYIHLYHILLPIISKKTKFA